MARIWDSKLTVDNRDTGEELVFAQLQIEFLKSEIERLTEAIRELSSTQIDK
jgi:hypothetical protein